MQAVILPDVQPTVSITEFSERRVTYQIAMCGKDGAVLASDQSERMVNYNGSVATQNLVKKIQVAGPFAWCFAGGKLSHYLADHFGNAVKQSLPVSASAAAATLSACAGPAFQDWKETCAVTGEGYTLVTLLCGAEKRIFRNPMSRSGECDEMQGGWSVGGNEFNVASFLPRRIYSPNMSVDELACLAAYSIHMAHDFDSAFVNGLDIAIYRDSIDRFEFVDSAFYWSQIDNYDAAVRKAIKECAPAKAHHLQK